MYVVVVIVVVVVVVVIVVSVVLFKCTTDTILIQLTDILVWYIVHDCYIH